MVTIRIGLSKTETVMGDLERKLRGSSGLARGYDPVIQEVGRLQIHLEQMGKS